MSTDEVAPFIAACRCQPTPYTPVWIMRQAGRYLPEYRRVREKADFVTLTKTPELATEVTLQPVRRFGMDAAILFSDIMTPLEGMGIDIEFNPGPVIADPVQKAADVDRLRIAEPEESIPFVLEAIRQLRRELKVPLIGFAGAPFTLFCYVVEGGGSKTFNRAKSFLMSEPEAADRLLYKLGDTVARCLEAQAAAGAQALMLFDSWAGLLTPEDYSRHALPVVQAILNRLRALDVPLIYFPNQGATLMGAAATLPADVIGVDWRMSLHHARTILGPEKAVQGNLDPVALFAPPEELERRIDVVLDEAGPTPGHVFNLGHGIDRHTDPDAVARLVDRVHETSARRVRT